MTKRNLRIVWLLTTLLCVPACSRDRQYAKFKLPNGESLVVYQIREFEVSQPYTYAIESASTQNVTKLIIGVSDPGRQPQFELRTSSDASAVIVVEHNAPQVALVVYDLNNKALWPSPSGRSGAAILKSVKSKFDGKFVLRGDATFPGQIVE